MIQKIIKALLDACDTGKEERKAQQRAINWTAGATVAMATFAFVSLITAIVTVCILRNQLGEMRSENRAWVDMAGNAPDNALRRDERGLLFFTLRMTAENSGHSPARFGMLWAKMFVRSPTAAELGPIRKHCETMRERPINEHTEGVTIFPNGKMPQGYGVELSADDESRLVKSATNGTTLMIAGCFDYLLSDGTDHHQTSFVFEVNRRGPVNEGVQAALIIDPSRDIPVAPDQLLLQINPGLANNAD